MILGKVAEIWDSKVTELTIVSEIGHFASVTEIIYRDRVREEPRLFSVRGEEIFRKDCGKRCGGALA